MRLPRYLSKKNILTGFMVMFMAIGPFSVTEFNKINILLIFFASSITIFLCLLLGGKIKLLKFSTIPSSLYLFSFIVSLFAIILTREQLTGEFVSSVIFGRIFTFVTVIFTMMIINSWLAYADESELIRSLKVAFFTGLLFVLLGHWQFVGNMLGFPFFIETRDWMHGVPSAIRSVVPKRLTSIAEEPNYLSPLLIEFLLLSSVLIASSKKKLFAYFLGGFVVVFSFSGGVYVNMMLILIIIGALSLYRSLVSGYLKGKDILFIILALLGLGILLSVGDILLEFLYYKFQGEAAGKSARSQFLSSLGILISQSSFLELLVGHGMATMSVLPEFGLAKEEFLFRITNNFYLDMIWEGGFIGLACIIFFLGYLIYFGLKNYLFNKYYELGLLLSLHLSITCLYRSEYLSPHFLWVVSLIFICYRIGMFQTARDYNSKEDSKNFSKV
ncbi:hypothetical protein FLM48_14215 [Shewanella sp. Scap07]|uniref:hypothetical protein n=1 Tax=Shewanella sp. Scap07 TaxID=2589987 RepID=UPI0015BE5542|nr:hypothetical protein [Shewanella sp. Scap07]QLE86120.1 hypothetical protein FLM48_14215 [Shewanella sp. Scap07]